MTRTNTLSDPNKTLVVFYILLVQVGCSRPDARKVEVDADVRHQLMMHTCRSLLDSVSDFQRTRGKPLRRMLAEIKIKDSDFSLQFATAAKKLKLRWAYTSTGCTTS